MALDAVCLAAVLEELRAAVQGGKIDKIYQPARDEVVMGVRGTCGCCFQPAPAAPGSSSPP